MVYWQVTPIVLATMILVMYGIMHVCAKADVKSRLRPYFVQVFLLLTFMIYPACSTKIMQAFKCDTDWDPGSTVSFLQVDYSIDCNSPYNTTMETYAVVMIFIYPVGIPILYFILLYRHKRHLNAPRLTDIQVAEQLERHPDLQGAFSGEDGYVVDRDNLRLQLSVRLRAEVLCLRPYKFLFEAYEPHLWWCVFLAL
jgi:hypothetical protein